ncbi:MAG: PAS domain S-box protein [Microthrixaceae bacterium]
MVGNGSHDDLLDLAVDSTVVLDHSGTILAGSESAVRSFGYKREEWIGSSVLELVHPEDAASAGVSLYESAQEQGRKVPLNLRVRDSSGGWRPVEVVAMAVEDPVRAIVLSVRDHTDTAGEARRLADRGELYRQVVEMAAEGVWMIDSELRATFVSEPMAAMLGLDAEAMLGRRIQDFMDAEGRSLAERNFTRRIAGDREPQVYKLRHSNGSDVWVRVNLMELGPRGSDTFPAASRYEGSIAVVSDITDEHLAAQRLAVAQQQQQALLDAIPDLVFRFDSQGVYLDYAGSREDLAMDPADFLGRPVGEVVPPVMADAVMGAIDEALDTGSRQLIEYQLDVEGGLRDFEARISPSGADTVVAICRDVTSLREGERARREWALEIERREQAEERAELERKMHQAGRLDALGRLTGGVAHDVNNLLGVIANYASVIRSSTSDAAILQDLNEIEEAVRRGSELTNRLLQVGRNADAQPSEVVVGDIVANICDVLERTGGDTSVSLRVEVAEPVARARIDRSQLEQAVMNLVINARDASPAGSEVVVRVDAEPMGEGTEGEILVSVLDSGTGIPEEDREQVLEPFYTTKDAGKGTGLGLSVVHRVVTEAAGRLEIGDVPGGGARVSMGFPMTTGSPRVASGPQVLVVDDDPDSLRSTKRVLEANGVSVVTADGCESAIAELMKSDELAAVLTDVVMPAGSGIELDRTVRSLRPGLPVVFMTGHAALAGSSLPTDRPVLAKPLSVGDLLASIRPLVPASR